ncbi:MAG: hypothetical protein WDZ60_09775, partial [Wenzhouxiangellaceae bacterium]
LYWDDANGRADWRKERLNTAASIPVRAPIYYGRKSRSRGDSYTMTFRRDDPSGVAILIPCQRRIESINDLNDEAAALWKAEAPRSGPAAIGSDWGCVGALLGSGEARETLGADWNAHFREIRGEGMSIVGPDGELDLVWPATVTGKPAAMDIILATATLPEAEPPTTQTLADAWLNQNGGYERYFFENVRHGIRTTHDLEIWRCIEAGEPSWLETDGYHEAVKVLRGEARGS